MVTCLKERKQIGNLIKNKIICVSIIIPVRDEAGNLEPLHKKILEVSKLLPGETEIIYVENGSSDNSLEVLKQLEGAKVIELRMQEGVKKTLVSKSISEGIRNSSGSLVAIADGDGEVDPMDIIRLYDHLGEGNDAVFGWIQKREASMGVRLVSFIGNKLRRMLGFRSVHNSACGLKIFKKECIQNIPLFGEWHCYLPDLMEINGFKVSEVPIAHTARVYGKSKFKSTKALRFFSDLLCLWFIKHFVDRPMQFFGSVGIVGILVGIGSGFGLGWGWGLGLILFGILMISVGFAGDRIAREFYKNLSPFFCNDTKERRNVLSYPYD